MSEWLKETGCKPVGYAYAGSNPAPPTGRAGAAALRAQSTSSAAATRSVTVRPRPVGALRWPRAQLAQLVEHFHGKEGVVGSSPTLGSARKPRSGGVFFSCAPPGAAGPALGGKGSGRSQRWRLAFDLITRVPPGALSSSAPSQRRMTEGTHRSQRTSRPSASTPSGGRRWRGHSTRAQPTRDASSSGGGVLRPPPRRTL